MTELRLDRRSAAMVAVYLAVLLVASLGEGKGNSMVGKWGIPMVVRTES
jgi:hypothetical protein